MRLVQLVEGDPGEQPSSFSGVVMSNREALEVTLAELERMGRIEPVDTARVQALRSMADALDERPFNSQFWREYRESLEELMSVDGDDGAIDDLLAELSGAVRDPKEG